MSDHPDNTLIAWLLGGGGLVAAGSGLKWLWDKVIRHRAEREAKIDAREDEYVTKMEARLAKVEQTMGQQATQIHEQSVELERHRLALALLVNDVAAHRPSALVLHQVRAILGQAFPLPFPTPNDVSDLASRIE